MTNHPQTADVGELNQAIIGLTKALVRTERRVRLIHWSLLVGLVLLVVAGFLIAKWIGAASASFNQFRSAAMETVGRNKNFQEHVDLFIRKTIVKNNLKDKQDQMTGWQYVYFTFELTQKMTPGERWAFVDNLRKKMTRDESKTLANELRQEMLPEIHSSMIISLPEMTPEQIMDYVYSGLVLKWDEPILKWDEYMLKSDERMLKSDERMLKANEHMRIFIKAFARILPPEKHKPLLIEALTSAVPPGRYEAFLVKTLADTVTQEEYVAFRDKPSLENEAITGRVIVEKTTDLFVNALVGDDISRQLEVIGKALKSVPDMVTVMKEMSDHMGQMDQNMGQMDQKMSSVPAMAAQMDLMNRNMGSMTHSMGSTMGRMGKWMPW